MGVHRGETQHMQENIFSFKNLCFFKEILQIFYLNIKKIFSLISCTWIINQNLSMAGDEQNKTIRIFSTWKFNLKFKTVDLRKEITVICSHNDNSVIKAISIGLIKAVTDLLFKL